MINAIPRRSTLYGVLVGTFTENTHSVVNPVIGIENFNDQNPALVVVAEDTDNQYILSSDVYGNLSRNNWEPSENFNSTLVTALQTKIQGVTFTPGSANVLNNPDMAFSV